jgi:hypothetical protein
MSFPAFDLFVLFLWLTPDLICAGNFKLPEFVVDDGAELKLRYVVKVLSSEDQVEQRGGSDAKIFCGRYRQELIGSDSRRLDMEWKIHETQLAVDESIIDHSLHGSQDSNRSVWVSATKSINVAVKFASIFQDLALLDLESASGGVKDLEKKAVNTVSDQQSHLLYAHLIQEVLLYKEAKIARIFRMRIPAGGCKIWPPHADGDKNLFPPVEDFEGKNFDEKFDRQLISVSSTNDGVELLKWKGCGGAEEKWFLVKRLKPSAVNKFVISAATIARHHLRLVWVANEAARTLLSESRPSKDQSIPVAVLPCRLYEFCLAFDEDDYCGDARWQDSFLLFALEAGELKVPYDLESFKKSRLARSETEDEIMTRISCEDVCRLAIVDSLLGICGLSPDDARSVVDRISSRPFAFRMPSVWDFALGSTVMQLSRSREELRSFHEPASAVKLLEELCTEGGCRLWKQKPGWFDQGDRGKQALVKNIKDMCGEPNRMEFDSGKSMKLTKVLMYLRLLDSASDELLPASYRVADTFEESFRNRVRVLVSLVVKLEKRDFESDLSYLNEAAKSVLKEEQTPRMSLLFSDPLPSNPSDRGQSIFDFEYGETGCSANAAENLIQDALQGIHYSLQIGTAESLRVALLNYSLIHITAKAYISESGILQLVLERPQREGVDRMNLGFETISLDMDVLSRMSPSDILGQRYLICQLFFHPQLKFKSIDFAQALNSFRKGTNKFSVLIIDSDNTESPFFMKGLYENLKKGKSFQDSVLKAGESLCAADFIFPSNLSTSFVPRESVPWKIPKPLAWKGTSTEDRSRPAQIENPSLLARMDWTGSNISFGRNEELYKMVQGLDATARILVYGAHFEDVCSAAYELFRFCSQRSWKGKTLLARVDGVLGEAMLKRDVVRILCRENEDEPLLTGEEAKRSGQSSRAERRFSDEPMAADEDPDDELSTLVRQSGIDLYIIVDGTGLRGQKNTKLAEYIGFVGDSRNRITFGDRQKVIMFTSKPLKGYQGHEIRLGGLGTASNASKEYFCSFWKRNREDDIDPKKRRIQDRTVDVDSVLGMLPTIFGSSTEVERYVIRFLGRLNQREICRFSTWIQDKSESPSIDTISAFLFDTLRPEEQGAFLALTVFDGRFDGTIVSKILGKWEDCAETGYRSMMHRSGSSLDDEQDVRKKIQWAISLNKGLVDGTNPDSKRSVSGGVHRQFLFHEIVIEKLVKVGLVSKTADSVRRADERVQYILADHIREWGRLRISEICKVSPHLADAFYQRRSVVADYISERLLEAGSQSATSLNAAWDAHQHDWFRLVNLLKDSEDSVAVCRLSKLLWSSVLGNSWNFVFCRYPRSMFKGWAERSSVLRDDLLETSVVISFARLEFIKACCDLEYKDKETYEPVLKVLEFALDALEQNWSALAPFSVDFNNNVLDYFLCKAEILGLQGQIRSWIRKDPKEKDALRLFEEAILSCFGGRTPMDDEHILHKVLLSKIQTNVGNSLRSVGHRELKHYQKKEVGKRKRGALEEILNYFKHAEECFEKSKELCFRQNVYNRNQLFGDKYHDIHLSRAHHNLSLCKLGLARTLRQMEVESSGEIDDVRGPLPYSAADVLRDARTAVDRALSARVKWGQRGNLSLQIEALNSRVVLCNILYEMRPEEREPNWKEVVSRVRRLLIEDISVLKERKRADLMTHSQRSALRSARKEADKALGTFRDLFEDDEGVHMADSGIHHHFKICSSCSTESTISIFGFVA